MGNTIAPYKRMQEKPSAERPYSPLSSKMDSDDTHATSVGMEMETTAEVEGNRKWLKGYTPFGVQGETFCRKWCKSWTGLALCSIVLLVIVTVAVVLGVKFANTGSTPNDSFVTKEELHALYRYVNESLLKLQNHQGKHCGCNNSLVLQLQEEINSVQEQMKVMQSDMVVFNGLVSTIQTNITDMNDQVNILKKDVENLAKKSKSFESDLDNVRGSVSGLARKVNILDATTSNLSAVDHLQNIDEALAQGNISELVTHVRNSVTVLSDSQDRIINQVSSLQHNVSQLGSEVHTLHDSVQQQSARAQDIATYSNRLDQMESSVTSLSTKVRSPLRLYESCRKDTVSCRIDPIRRDDYWRDCATDYLDIDIEGWHTVNYQCEYESASRMNMEALTPFVSNGRVRCDCDITYPGNDNEHHRPVPRDMRGVCTLVVTRCPLSQTLFN